MSTPTFGSLLQAANLTLEISTWAQEKHAVFALLQNSEVAISQGWDHVDALEAALNLGQSGERLLLARDFSGRLQGAMALLRKAHAPVREGAVYRSATGQISAAMLAESPDASEVLRALLNMASDLARELHISTLECTPPAAKDAASYRACGFEAQAHRWQKLMALNLPIARTGDVQRAEPHPVGELIGSKTRAELLHISLQLLSAAKREICIYTRDLDAPIFDQAALLESLRQLSIQFGARIRVLVQDCTRAQKDGHRLLELARRMSSAFAFRSPQAEDLQYPSAFLLNDRSGFLLRPLASRFDAEGNTYDPPAHDTLRRYFDEVWERSPPTIAFRRLSL
jgi:hypothetical protein